MKYLWLAIVGCWGLLACQSEAVTLHTGPADTRLVGTWRLLERQAWRDSVYSFKRDSITVTRDTSFIQRRTYSPSPAQTLTFAPDGTLSANGAEMSYYFPLHAFRLDATYPDSLFLNLYITTNRATTFSQQRLLFQHDTLVLRPDADTFSKFLKK